MVEVVALLPDGRHVTVGHEYFQLLQAAWTTLKDQIANLVGPGLYASKITHLVVPVTSDAALKTVILSTRCGLQKKHGALPKLPHEGQESLYKHARIAEAAIAVGFGYVIDQAKQRIDRTFYRGWLTQVSVADRRPPEDISRF